MILKKIAVCTTIAGLCTALIGAAVIPASSVEANSTNVIRLAGDTRYDTMSRIIQAEVPGTSEYVVVASGDNFPDALAAAPLAGALKAPIVLTSGNVLSPQAEQQITRLKASKAVIIGGVNAISRATVSRIHGLVGSVPIRISGETRYETSLRIYLQGKARLGVQWSSAESIIATGENFADALSVSAYAYAEKAPIFLANPKNGFSSETLRAISGNFRHQLVVGGENAVPELVITQLMYGTSGGVGLRVYGENRYDTSRALADYMYAHNAAVNNSVFATGENFPDALAGGPLAGRSNAMVLLANTPDSPSVQWAHEHSSGVNRVYLLGGASAVNRATADAVANAFGGEHIIDIDAVSRRLQSAKEAQTAAEAKQKSAVQAEAKAKADADTKQSEADNAVRAYQIASADAAAKKTAADNATSQWDKGGRGFYETYGYNDALGFFDSDSWESRQYREAVAEGNIRPNDSGSSYQLEHMVQAIPTLKKVNEIRKGLGLNELKWSAYETAMAQACADYNIYSPWTGHGFNDGSQNMSTGYSEPTEGWYTEEKRIWDAAVAKDSSLTRYIGHAYQLSQDNFDLYSEVGHYLNIVDPYTTDFGGAVAWGGNAQGWGDNSQRVQNYNTGVGDLTVAEYEKQLNQYIANLKNAGAIYRDAKNKATQAGIRSQQASDALRQSKQKEAIATANRESADRNLEKANAELDDAQKAYDDAIRKM